MVTLELPRSPTRRLRMRTRLVVAVLGVGLALTGCAERGGSPSSGSVALPADGDALVLRIDYTGGFVTPETTVGRLPLVSVYRDGRVITEGPVIAIYPAPAWPNLQVAQLDEAGVQELADAARDAGVAQTGDLGMPNIADAATTRFTLVTETETFVREAYALTPDGTDVGYTAEQQSARAALAGLLQRFTVLDEQTTGYEPTAVAAIAGPYVEPTDQGLGSRPPVAWPGPDLPGEPVGPGIGCVVATGEQAAAVATAAQAADSLTPWTSGASSWAVTFRPLLPDETGCADLG